MTAIVANDGAPLKLTWDYVLEKYNNLIKYMAGNYARNNTLDGMVTSNDLYQEGLVKLYDCWVKWCLEHNKDEDEFGPIFKVSLQRCMQQHSKRKFQTVDSEEVMYSVEDPNIKDVGEQMYQNDSIQLLADSLTPTAKVLLEELINPSERTLFEVWADSERKKMIKSQGKRVNIPKDNTVRMKHIVRAIGITDKQYDNAMKEIREKAPQFIER